MTVIDKGGGKEIRENYHERSGCHFWKVHARMLKYATWNAAGKINSSDWGQKTNGMRVRRPCDFDSRRRSAQNDQNNRGF